MMAFPFRISCRPRASARPRWALLPVALLAVTGAGPASDAPPAPPAEAPALPPPGPPPDGPPPARPDPAELFAQLQLLYEFLSLPPEQLQRVRETVALIERLSPAERARMRARLERMQHDLQGIEEDLSHFHPYAGGDSAPALRRLWLSLSEPERRALKDHFSTLDESTRRSWLEARLERFRRQEERLREQLEAAAEAD